MNKNPNKKAGNWGALKNKPQNLVPFKSGGKVKVTAGGEKHVIYKKTTKRGEGKVGNIMVNHPTKDKGVWDTIDLTKKSGATTVKQGVASTKKWHKENPYNDMKTNKKQMGGPSQKSKTVTKNGSYRTVEKMKSTPSSMKESSKTTRTGYGILKGAPKYKNVIPAPMPAPIDPMSGGSYMKKGGAKKYQAGGTQSTVEKARNIGAGIKKNTSDKKPTRAAYKAATDQLKINVLTPDRINYLNRKENKYDPNIAEAIRLSKVKGENNAKFKRAPHPSDVLGKPKYLKKTGGSIKKKK